MAIALVRRWWWQWTDNGSSIAAIVVVQRWWQFDNGSGGQAVATMTMVVRQQQQWWSHSGSNSNGDSDLRFRILRFWTIWAFLHFQKYSIPIGIQHFHEGDTNKNSSFFIPRNVTYLRIFFLTACQTWKSYISMVRFLGMQKHSIYYMPPKGNGRVNKMGLEGFTLPLSVSEK